MRQKFFLILLLTILILPAIHSLLSPGFFSSHDGDWMVIRLSDFHRSVVSGQIPVRWGDRLNHGYGYPVFNFSYPFSLYFGEVFRLLGFGFVDSVKIVFALGFILSGVFMYLWLREKWGNLGALVSAVLYVYTPYRFLDVYVRGSLGEATAFIFPPLIFWSAEKLADKWQKSYFILGSLAFAGLITSHNIMAMLFALVFLSYLIFRWLIFRDRKVFLCQLTILILGLLLSCFFWLPALYDKQYVLFDKVVVADFFAHFPTLPQLLLPSWGYGPSLPFSDQDTLSFQVGVINLIVFLLVILRLRLINLRKNFLTYFLVLAFAGAFLLMLGPLGWFWKILPLGNLIQFPWRLLMLTTFSSAVLAGGLVQSIKPSRKAFLAVGLIALSIFLTYKYARPEYFVDKGELFYSTNESTTTIANEYMPIWVKLPPVNRAAQAVEIVSGEGSVSAVLATSKKISFTVSSENESLVQINKIYFPGWQVKLDDKTSPIAYDNPQGLIRLPVSVGKHTIVAEFGETPVRLAADIVSLLGLGIIFVLVLKRK